MKILVISNLFPPNFIGGYELGALDFVQYLKDEGYEVRVLTSSLLQDDKNILNYIDIHRTLSIYTDFNIEKLSNSEKILGTFYIPQNIRILTSHLIDFNPNIILCFNLTGLGQAAIITFLQSIQIPAAIYYMDDIFCSLKYLPNFTTEYNNIFGKININKFINIFLSNVIYKEIENTLKTSIYNPFFIPNHHKMNNPPVIKEIDGLKIIFSSRIAAHKGIWILLDSIFNLKNYIQNIHLDIYGDGEIDYAQFLIFKLGLQNYVTLKGSLAKEKLIYEYCNYNIMALPTWHREPGPYVVAEAAACGCLPVISGGIGIAEYFIHNYDCIKCQRNSDSICRELLKIYKMPINKFLTIRNNSQNTAFKYLNFSKVSKLLENILLSNQKEYSLKTKNLRQIEISIYTLFEIWKEKTNVDTI